MGIEKGHNVVVVMVIMMMRLIHYVNSVLHNVHHAKKITDKYNVISVVDWELILLYVYALAIITIVDNQIVHNVLLNVFNAIILAIIVLNVLEIDKCQSVVVVLVIMMMK